jgi:hypothetical protein
MCLRNSYELDGIKYNNSLSINKPISNMNDNFYITPDKIDYELLNYNIEMFRKFLEE